MTATSTQVVYTSTRNEKFQVVAVLRNEKTGTERKREDTTSSSVTDPRCISYAISKTCDRGLAKKGSDTEKTGEKSKEYPSSAKRRTWLNRVIQGCTGFMATGVNQDKVMRFIQACLCMIGYFFFQQEQGNFQTLRSDINSARYIFRFLGLPASIAAAQHGSWAASSDSHAKLHVFVGKLMAWTMVGYYPLENAAYLLWYLPNFFSTINGVPRYQLANIMSMWSCRFWFAYVVAEIFQSGLKLHEETQKGKYYAKQKKEDAPVDHRRGTPPSNAALWYLRMQLLRQAFYLLPALHWSFVNSQTDPWLPEPLVYTLMWLESVVCMIQTVTVC